MSRTNSAALTLHVDPSQVTSLREQARVWLGPLHFKGPQLVSQRYADTDLRKDVCLPCGLPTAQVLTGSEGH